MDSTILKISDALYPPLLREIKNPPQLLYCAGDLSLLKTRCVAVVGSRKITAYGRRIAAKVAGRLAACGLASLFKRKRT